jgi:hypothetical protein
VSIDRFAPDPTEITIATTGKVVKIDIKNRTLKVRGAEPASLSLRGVSQNFAQVMQGLKERIGVVLPGGISITLPGRSKNPPRTTKDTPQSKSEDLQEYIVAITSSTVFQDGGDVIRFEDFKTGETISIHGVLEGKTIVASRIAKWF